MMDRLMGGNGIFSETKRDFNEIEIDLIRGIMAKMISLLGFVGRTFIDINPVM